MQDNKAKEIIRKHIRESLDKKDNMENSYDSREDTEKHIARVNELAEIFSEKFKKQTEKHDSSKLTPQEKPFFDSETPKLKNLTYNTPEYKESLKTLGKALDNHYKLNSHHPEHYKNGIDDMNLFDVVEMFLDWKAAGERHNDGNIYDSIDKNKDRFKMSKQLENIFKNTAEKMGWKKK